MTPNCNNSDGGNNGVELRDLNNPNASQTTPDELTGLTEHLRRHTGKQCQQARLQSPRQGFLNFCGNAHVTKYTFHKKFLYQTKKKEGNQCHVVKNVLYLQ